MWRTHLHLESSATVAINSQALEKKARGERVYNLSAGEPMLAPHPLVVAAAERAIRDGKTLYPPVAGLPELRLSAATWINTTYGANFSVPEALITCGGKFAIFATLQASVQLGDEVIIVAPYWVSYPAIVKLFGARPVIVETKLENNWELSTALVRTAVTPRTKMIIINNGGNPTGALYSKEVMAELVQLAHEQNIILLSDEVYSGLTYAGEYVSAGSFSEGKENVVVVQSCSKHFAMTGWRVGMVFGPESIIKILTQIQGQSTTGAASISQWTALAAIQNATEIIPWVRAAMQKRRDVFITAFNTLFSANLLPPATALYSFFPLTALGVAAAGSRQFCLDALERGSVALVPGSAFGKEGYARASFGVEEPELVAALRALKKFITSDSLGIA